MNKFLILSLLALGYQSASAQLVTESFGSGDNSFTMEFVTIGNPGNAADITGYGSVAYTYNLGKYEVSRGQIDKANAAGSLGITMYDMSSIGGNGANRPATEISWNEAATHVNWLNTSTGNTAAYKFVGGTFQLWSPTDAGYNANNMFRNSNAKFWLPSTDEWYKGAYGGLNGTWNNFPTGSDSVPMAVAGGTDANTAVYGQTFTRGRPADITNAGGLSPYGTMGQGGNVQEWIETAYDGSNDTVGERQEMRGGDWFSFSSDLDASGRTFAIPSHYFLSYGFRVAMVPEPSSLSLLALGGVVVALRRRR